MPKGKKKGKFEHRRTELPYSSDEDAGIDMTNDNYSETSGQSDLRSNHDEAENEAQEKFEEKVLEIIDALSARSNAARASALVALRSALQRRYLEALLSGQRATLADHVTKALRRGKDGEKKAAAAVAPILALQLGEEGVEEFMLEVRPALAAAAADRSASLDTRTECCSSLAILCYLMEDDLAEVLEVMKLFETIFSGSYLKGDGSVKVSGAAVEEGAWHAAAVDGWALLLGLTEPDHARALLRDRAPGVDRLADMLEACSLEVRMAAGGALAIAHERVTEDEEEGDGGGRGVGAGAAAAGGARAGLAQVPRQAGPEGAARDLPGHPQVLRGGLGARAARARGRGGRVVRRVGGARRVRRAGGGAGRGAGRAGAALRPAARRAAAAGGRARRAAAAAPPGRAPQQAAAAPAEHGGVQGAHRRAQQEPRQALGRARRLNIALYHLHTNKPVFT